MKPRDETAAAGKTGLYLSWAARVLTACLVIKVALAVIHPFFDQPHWMMYQEDDFFYYLKIAANIAQGHGSTFNGIVSTNGYHPLWLALLAGVCGLFPAHMEIAVQVFLAIGAFIATLATYMLSRRILSERLANPLLMNALAAYVALYATHFFFGGMEVILTVPLLFAVVVLYQRERLWSGSFGEPLCFGLLLAALALSRLDAILIVALLAAATLLSPELRAKLKARSLAGVCVGFLPVPLYLLANHIYFGTWLPISGMAKQLKTTYLPSAIPWHSLFAGSGPWFNLLPIFLAIALLPVVFKKLPAAQKVIYPALLAFPFLHVLLLSCLSDWRLWDWYFYSLRVALCISFAVLLLLPPLRRIADARCVTAAIALVCLAVVLHKSRKPPGDDSADIFASAMEIRDFARTHPGIYAMGDRSGTVGYLLPDPLIQTEGLVMDRAFLKAMQNGTPLDRVLAAYNVRYYIATDYISTNSAPNTGCFHAVEPYQAGPASPHMMADLCQPPVAIFPHPHDKLQVLIFDLQGRSVTFAFCSTWNIVSNPYSPPCFCAKSRAHLV